MNRIVEEIKNANDRTYQFSIHCDNPAEFLRGLWCMFFEFMKDKPDDYFLDELTDRSRWFRTIYQNSLVSIYTHGPSNSFDKFPLDDQILNYVIDNAD